jgi:hypothetical protein
MPVISHVGHVGRSNRPRVILIVHDRNDTISLANVSGLLGGAVDIQTHFLPVLPHNEIVLAFNAQQVALDSVAAFQLTLFAPHTSLTAFPHRWICQRRRITGPRRITGLCRAGQAQAQQAPTTHESDDFAN